MSTITQAQALNFEQRLIALERKVGMERLSETTTTTTTTTSTTTRSSSDIASLDDRLSKLKADLNGKLAVSGSNSKIGNSNNNNATNQESWKTIQKLLKELDPGIALTHQQQPLLYKRQQVLACSDELGKDFRELESLLKLLLSGTKVDGAGNSNSNSNNTGNDPKSTDAKSKTSTTIIGSNTTTTDKATSKQEKLQHQAKEKAVEKLQQRQQQQQQRDTTTTTNSRSIYNNNNNNETLRLDQITQAPILTHPSYSSCATPSEQKKVQDLATKLEHLHSRTQDLTQRLQQYLECYHTTAMAVSEKIVLADEKITSRRRRCAN